MTPMDEVLQQIHEGECRDAAYRMVTRRGNMAGGRPSDNARSEVFHHQSMGCARYCANEAAGRSYK